MAFLSLYWNPLRSLEPYMLSASYNGSYRWYQFDWMLTTRHPACCHLSYADCDYEHIDEQDLNTPLRCQFGLSLKESSILSHTQTPETIDRKVICLVIYSSSYRRTGLKGTYSHTHSMSMLPVWNHMYAGQDVQRLGSWWQEGQRRPWYIPFFGNLVSTFLQRDPNFKPFGLSSKSILESVEFCRCGLMYRQKWMSSVFHSVSNKGWNRNWQQWHNLNPI